MPESNMKEPTQEEKDIVQQVIDVFWTQDRLARLLGVDQSSVSGWLNRGTIPAKRQKQIIEISKTLAAEGKINRALMPDDFHRLQPDLAKAA
jgi:ParB-like chromosome segregation protein Spo0J